MRRSSLALLLALAVGACRDVPQSVRPTTPPPERPEVKVALIGAFSGSDHSQAARALEAAQLRFEVANGEEGLPVEILATQFDTLGEAEAASVAMDEVLADPAMVANIIWPSGDDMAPLRADTGIAAVDVSPVGEGGEGSWGRLVAPDASLANALANLGGGRKACLAGDDSTRGMALVEATAAAIRRRGVRVALKETVPAGLPSYADLAETIGEARCRSLLWMGDAVDGATLLGEVESGLELIGTDRIVNEGFVEAGGELAEGAVAICPCADVSASTELEVQRFVQEHQSEFGIAPSTFSVEGWDAAGLVIEALRAGFDTDDGPSREAVEAALSPPYTYDGLAGSYDVDADGESDGPLTSFEVRQGSWIPGR